MRPPIGACVVPGSVRVTNRDEAWRVRPVRAGPRRAHVSRFVVQTVTGWPITDGEQHGHNARPPGVEYLVLDRADCYRVRGSFKPPFTKYRSKTDCERLAHELADRLEAECAQIEAA